MGVKSKDRGVLKDNPKPIDITYRFESVIFDHLSNLEKHNEMLCFNTSDGKQYEVILKEVEA